MVRVRLAAIGRLVKGAMGDDVWQLPGMCQVVGWYQLRGKCQLLGWHQHWRLVPRSRQVPSVRPMVRVRLAAI